MYEAMMNGKFSVDRRSTLFLCSGYTKNKEPYDAIELFRDVERSGLLREEPLSNPKIDGIDTVMDIYLSVIDALSEHGMSSVSKSIVKDIPSEQLLHPRIQNALVNMWVSGHVLHP